ncbi:MAG: hypothetical protein SV253_07140 [Halobacteria archaeon]|nr:hypothetical protein [Halobacteria archaeon]
MSVQIEDDTAEYAYAWGYAVGSRGVEDGEIEFEVKHRETAEKLADILGGEADPVTRERENAHRDVEGEERVYEVSAKTDADFHDDIERLKSFVDDGYEKVSLRGLLESCGTICYKKSTKSLGVSFSTPSHRLTTTIQDLIEPDFETGHIERASSGNYWFSVEDVDDFADYVYEDKANLYSPPRHDKLEGCREQVRQAE